MTLLQKLRHFFPIVTLLVLGVIGMQNVSAELKAAQTLGQRIAAYVELSFAIAGVAAAIELVRLHRAARTMMIIWGILVTLTSFLAPIVWGGQSILIGLVAAAGAAAIAWGMFWLAKPSMGPDARA